MRYIRVIFQVLCLLVTTLLSAINFSGRNDFSVNPQTASIVFYHLLCWVSVIWPLVQVSLLYAYYKRSRNPVLLRGFYSISVISIVSFAYVLYEVNKAFSFSF